MHKARPVVRPAQIWSIGPTTSRANKIFLSQANYGPGQKFFFYIGPGHVIKKKKFQSKPNSNPKILGHVYEF